MTEDRASGSSGPFFDFPTDDGFPDLSNEGMDILQDFLNRTSYDAFQQSEGVSVRPTLVPAIQPNLAIYKPSQYHFPEAVGESEGTPSQLQRLGPSDPVNGSSSSRELADLPANHGLDESAVKLRNRAAQKRFRERQKARRANHTKQVEDLEKKMEALMMENRGLKNHCKLLQHKIEVNTVQNTQLQDKQEERILTLQQEVILQESVRIYAKGVNQPNLTIEATKQLTMDGFKFVFEVLIHKYKLLLEAGARNPSSPEHSELEFLINGRRMEEGRLALFSPWTSAVIDWNREEAQSCTPPSQSFYATVLESLQLSSEQQQDWLAARRKLLEHMGRLKVKRDKAALAVGMMVLRQPHNHLTGNSKEEVRLREALEEEREAVLEFLFSCIDCCLSVAQEAYLDVLVYPWWPCVWTICNVLAHRQKNEPPDTLIDSTEEDPLFLQLSSVQLLVEPMLAKMGGLLIKRSYLAAPLPQDIVQAANKLSYKIADLQHLTVFEVMCGKHVHARRLTEQS